MLMLCCRKMHHCVVERAAVSQSCVLRAEAQEASRALMLRSRWMLEKWSPPSHICDSVRLGCPLYLCSCIAFGLLPSRSRNSSQHCRRRRWRIPKVDGVGAQELSSQGC